MEVEQDETGALTETVEGSELPRPTEPVMVCITRTSLDKHAHASVLKHPGKDRFAARKGWRRG